MFSIQLGGDDEHFSADVLARYTQEAIRAGFEEIGEHDPRLKHRYFSGDLDAADPALLRAVAALRAAEDHISRAIGEIVKAEQAMNTFHGEQDD